MKPGDIVEYYNFYNDGFSYGKIIDTKKNMMLIKTLNWGLGWMHHRMFHRLITDPEIITKVEAQLLAKRILE